MLFDDLPLFSHGDSPVRYVKKKQREQCPHLHPMKITMKQTAWTGPSHSKWPIQDLQQQFLVLGAQRHVRFATHRPGI